MVVETDVLVVGAGPVGLALAIELGTRGVRALVVERNDRGGLAPRAKTTNVRTRTHLRRWGIADKLAAASPFGVDYPNTMAFVTSLAGHPLARFENAFNASPVRSPLYPEHAQWIPQYLLERVLLEHARTLSGIDIRFGVSFTTAQPEADRVTSTLVGRDGTGLTVVSKYLVGADGARSTIRGLIGATMQGRTGLSRNYNIVFRAPGLDRAHRHGKAVIYWQVGPRGFSALGPMDRDDVWFFMPTGIAEGQTLSKPEAAALIAERTGIDLPYEILSADQWVANELLADRYQQGRLFLAGDACHLHPPAGGYGMNMGIGDGVDLGWKIAATLQGWGGPGLLGSYEQERRPVHRRIIDEAVANHAIVLGPPLTGIESDGAEGEALRAAVGSRIQATQGREFHTLGAVLGLGYENSPIIADERGAPAPFDGQVYRPNARPGQLAPHAWLPDGRSLYDTFGPGLTLLASTRADERDVEAALASARSRDIPLTLVRVDGFDFEALYGARLALVRPDQYVAWRGDAWTGPIIDHVLGWSAPT